MYRILHATHHRTGDEWCIYPDVRLRPRPVRLDREASPTRSARWSSRTTGRSTTGSSDELEIFHPRQIEFARLNLTYTVMSKRKLLQLVDEGAGRRLGRSAHADHLGACAAAATRRRRSAISATGSAWPRPTAPSTSALLEHCLREDLNQRAPRVMAVLRPAEGRDRRTIPRARSRSSRRSTTPRTRRPAPGRCRSPASSTSSGTTSARIRPGSSSGWRPAARCGCATPTSSRARGRQGREHGEVVELRCTYDPETRGGDAPDGRKVKGTLHWVSAPARGRRRGAAVRPPVHEAGSDERPAGEAKDFKATSIPTRWRCSTGCKVEPSLAGAAPGEPLPVRAAGLLLRRPDDSTPDHLVFNRTVTLRDTWAKIEKAQRQAG